MYRPPNGNWEEFIDGFANIIQATAREGTPTYIMGDYDVNSLKDPECTRASGQIQAAVSYSLLLLSSKSTHVATEVSH